MLAVINVRDKPVLDPVLLRHQPLRYGQSVKADNDRISEETRRTRCSRVNYEIAKNYVCRLYVILKLEFYLLFVRNRWFFVYWIICKGGSENEEHFKMADTKQ